MSPLMKSMNHSVSEALNASEILAWEQQNYINVFAKA